MDEIINNKGKNQKRQNQFYLSVPFIDSNENNDLLVGLEHFASMSLETVYMLDFLKKCFLFVSDRNTFLSDHSVEEVLSLGYDFFPKVIHIEDLPLLKDIHKVILQRLNGMNDLVNINYFSFDLRIKNESRYIMVHHKLKPVFVSGKVRFGIYLLISSVLKKSGHLRVHYNNGIDFDEYLFNSKKWRKGTGQILSIQEKNILKLAKQGRTNNEIAHELHLSSHTIRNIKTSIFQKLNVRSMIQAVIYAANRHLIFGFNNEQKPIKQLKTKKRRRLMMPNMILRIQKKLNIGQSINSIAKQEKISEGSIRYAINHGKLKKKHYDNS